MVTSSTLGRDEHSSLLKPMGQSQDIHLITLSFCGTVNDWHSCPKLQKEAHIAPFSQPHDFYHPIRICCRCVDLPSYSGIREIQTQNGHMRVLWLTTSLGIFTNATQKDYFVPLHFFQRNTCYDCSLNGILGVKWTHEGLLMDIWTDMSGRVSNDEIMLLQTTYKQCSNKKYHIGSCSYLGVS